MKTLIFACTFITLLAACNSNPKVIEAVDATAGVEQPAADPAASQIHKVVVEEVLHTSKYTYLNVSEDGTMTWIAIPKKEVKKGGTYYYRGGLKRPISKVWNMTGYLKHCTSFQMSAKILR